MPQLTKSLITITIITIMHLLTALFIIVITYIVTKPISLLIAFLEIVITNNYIISNQYTPNNAPNINIKKD